MTDQETFTVTEASVPCDGGARESEQKGEHAPLGHPKVYLKINPDTGDVVCPYCSRRYVLAEGAKVAAH